MKSPSEKLHVQPQLEVGPENDVYEIEANKAADGVMRMSNVESGKKIGSGENMQSMQPAPLAIRKMSEANTQGKEASPMVQENINKSSGQYLESGMQQEMSEKMGSDFSHVKLHTDGNANQMAQSISAHAFTYGNNIYFNQGQYNPSTPKGKHLLAHELAHTVQQGGNVSNKVQRATQTSTYGDFIDVNYGLIDQVGKKGVNAHIQFKPGPKVDAKKIAMVQAIKEVRHGQVKNLYITDKDNISPKGYKIDRKSEMASPAYGAQENLPLDQTKPGGQNLGLKYELGSYYKDNGALVEKNAVLVDSNASGPGGPHSGQDFETTALAIEGSQAGKYYGSVKWGWFTDGGGKAYLKDFRLSSIDVPSEKFFGAAEKWNASTTSGTLTIAADNTPYFGVKDGKLEEAGKLSEGTQVQVMGPRVENNTVYNDVKASGLNVDYNTFVKLDDLKKGEDSAPTVDLPLNQKKDSSKTIDHLNPYMKGFISDGQAHMQSINNKGLWQLQTTFYSGHVYRFAIAAGLTMKNVGWIVNNLSDKGKIIFNSTENGNADHWDFTVDSTTDVLISAKLMGGFFNNDEYPTVVGLLGFKSIK